MNSKWTKRHGLVFGAIIILVSSIATAWALHVYSVDPGRREDAKTFLTAVSSLSVIVAVTSALFSDRLKAWADPIRLSIETIEHPNNEDDTHKEYGKVRLFHLRVKNLTPHLALENCTVWLEHVLDETSAELYERRLQFAVPRLMHWAPSDVSEEIGRTFALEHVFDFGMLRRDNGHFLITLHKDQGGYLRDDQRFECVSGHARRYCFKITADNYTPTNHHVVEVRVGQPNSPNLPSMDIRIFVSDQLPGLGRDKSSSFTAGS